MDQMILQTCVYKMLQVPNISAAFLFQKRVEKFCLGDGREFVSAS